jgi:hypothetical protein
MSKTTSAALVVAASMLVLASTAVAGKPGSSLSLVLLSSSSNTTLASAAADPSYGSEVTFHVSSTSDRPFVNLRCYQNGAFVYDGWHGFFESYVPEPNFTLTSLSWTGGAAECTARLVEWSRNGRQRTLASLDFHVVA